MFIGYLAVGVFAGVIAAAAALLAGSSLLEAFVIYCISGLIGTGLGALTLLFPPQHSSRDSTLVDAQPKPNKS